MKTSLCFLVLMLAVTSCNNSNEKDTVEIADSINKSNIDSAITHKSTTVDAASAEFMVKAANSAMTGADLAGLAQQKANSPAVKEFASLLLSDHSAETGQLKMLAVAKNVVLPEAPSDDKLKIKNDLSAKSGKDFDKAFIQQMIKDHDAGIELYEDAMKNVKDPDVTSFADKTLQKLREHLSRAKSIRESL